MPSPLQGKLQPRHEQLQYELEPLLLLQPLLLRDGLQWRLLTRRM